MVSSDPFRARQIGDRPRHLHQSVTAPGYEVEPATGGVEHPQAGRVEGAVTLQRASLESGVQAGVA